MCNGLLNGQAEQGHSFTSSSSDQSRVHPVIGKKSLPHSAFRFALTGFFAKLLQFVFFLHLMRVGEARHPGPDFAVIGTVNACGVQNKASHFATLPQGCGVSRRRT